MMKKVINFNGTPRSGIINYIKKISNKDDIHSARKIEIKVSSNGSATSYEMTIPIGVTSASGSAYWISTSTANQWYQIDFRSYKVLVKSYDYRAASYDFFSGWKLLGSDDEYSWTTLDVKTRTSYPEKSVMEDNHYDCSENINKAFSYIRLQVSGTRKYDGLGFALYLIDFYGTIFSSNSFCTRYIKRRETSLNVLIIILMLTA